MAMNQELIPINIHTVQNTYGPEYVLKQIVRKIGRATALGLRRLTNAPVKVATFMARQFAESAEIHNRRMSEIDSRYFVNPYYFRMI